MDIKQNSATAWLLAARPKTLSGAAVPVLMGLALAFYDGKQSSAPFLWIPAVLCLLFAFTMQIDANLINDLVDFKKGSDTDERLGPRRATAQGWISESAMKKGIAFTTALAGLFGLPLILYGGWWLIAVGLACMVFAFLYTTHFSYWGLGDILVLLFFGIVPVTMTYFVQTGTVTKEVVYSGIACGMVIDTLLIVNNYRDRFNDRKAGKKTLVVRIGARATEILYLALALMACHMGLVFFFQKRFFIFFLPFIYLSVHARTYRKMKKINHGKALNAILAENARNIMLYGMLFCMGALADAALL